MLTLRPGPNPLLLIAPLIASTSATADVLSVDRSSSKCVCDEASRSFSTTHGSTAIGVGEGAGGFGGVASTFMVSVSGGGAGADAFGAGGVGAGFFFPAQPAAD